MSHQSFDFSFYYDVSEAQEQSFVKRKCECHKGDTSSVTYCSIDLVTCGITEESTQGVMHVIHKVAPLYAEKEINWFSSIQDIDHLAALILTPDTDHPFRRLVCGFAARIVEAANISAFDSGCNLTEQSGLAKLVCFLSSMYQMICDSCEFINNSHKKKVQDSTQPADGSSTTKSVPCGDGKDIASGNTRIDSTTSEKTADQIKETGSRQRTYSNNSNSSSSSTVSNFTFGEWK